MSSIRVGRLLSRGLARRDTPTRPPKAALLTRAAAPLWQFDSAMPGIASADDASLHRMCSRGCCEQETIVRWRSDWRGSSLSLPRPDSCRTCSRRRADKSNGIGRTSSSLESFTGHQYRMACCQRWHFVAGRVCIAMDRSPSIRALERLRGPSGARCFRCTEWVGSRAGTTRTAGTNCGQYTGL